MENDPLIAQFREMRHEFVSTWLSNVSERLPDRFDTIELYQQGTAYFTYITDLHIPAELHPALHSAVNWYIQSDQKEIQYFQIMYSSHSWRRALLEVGELWLTVSLLKQLFARIDYFEMEVCRSFRQHEVVRFKQRDVAMDELHEDRMNLVGKMAASMAHEIRNPLTSIKGFLKLLRSGIQNKVVDKPLKYLDFIEHECDNIHMQVTGFLSFSKKPIMEEELVSISVKQVLEHNLSLLGPRLINENVDLTLSVPAETTLLVQKLAIQQVLSNLLNNGIDALTALKSERKIHISAYEDANHVYIEVSNNGPRIPAALQKTIFNPFVTDKANGTGLGLAICKQIMAKNHGDISFTSNDTETSFLLTFAKTESGVCAS
ncbi:sensor histidine kinase [Paenibacillus xerothermodurans]|uniref:histidine kinase n=1 Tax=Paenibacillus xerothermodurans TaxID=1977292 RepID=A0A2W1NPC6_PAEXE|nr:HAMP domain-containing sensor histidine kinase [Paenibacillus xerothermodurans]PZE21345.1 sensor histidine kinase [Paenibacillus xerothermodurans]